MRIQNREELDQIRDMAAAKVSSTKCRILICAGTGCLAGGSGEIYEKMCELTKDCKDVDVEFGAEIAHSERDTKENSNVDINKDIDVNADVDKGESVSGIEIPVAVKRSGCHGFCEMGPLMRIEPLGILYTKVKLEDCEEIFERTIKHGNIIHHLLYKQDGIEYPKQEEIPFYEKQTRLVLKNCGHIDAEHIEEYIAVGGYQSFAKVLFEQTPNDVIETILESNLRGRGGGGFQTGYKWKQVARQQEKIRYIVCNGDEGDPGAFMDRSIMEGDPHKMIEGMLIAAYAVGAQEGYIYVRAEYPLAISRLRLAISQAEDRGLLGEHILGTDFSFHLHINRGAGAFVCGEGSALTASIEGKRGMPRVKPPRTVEQGLFAKPTVLNNVETFANVPMIIEKGAKWYRSIGPENSPGTKAFALTGSVKNTGLIEVPMGTSLRHIIYDIGGGLKSGAAFKGVQIGGPSGGCLIDDQIDHPLDFDSVKKLDAIMGSGGMVVMDDSTCMVNIARFFLDFTARESCGKCVPCRIGTTRMMEILNRICDGQGQEGDIEMLEQLCVSIKDGSLCGLGQTAPNPVLTTIRYFRDEYEAHIRDKKCPAHECSALLKISIDPTKCKGCTVCARKCPVECISGERKTPHVIDQSSCIKCKQCVSSCKFDAIVVD